MNITTGDVANHLLGLRDLMAQALSDEEQEALLSTCLSAAFDRFEGALQMVLRGSVVVKMRPSPDLVLGKDYDVEEMPFDWERRPIHELPRFVLRRRPVISVERVRLELSRNFPVMTLPDSWIRLHKEMGILTIMPVSDVAVTLHYSGTPFMPLIQQGWPWSVVPQYVCIDYTAGVAEGTRLAEQDNLAWAIAEEAAVRATYTLLDMIPSGLSLDGLSQSFAAVENRLEARQKRIEEFIKSYRRRHLPPEVFVL